MKKNKLKGQIQYIRDFKNKIYINGLPLIDKFEIVYYCDGLIHRQDGPAIITSGAEYWVKSNDLHREDGPAVIFSDGNKQWWVNGTCIKYGR